MSLQNLLKVFIEHLQAQLRKRAIATLQVLVVSCCPKNIMHEEQKQGKLSLNPDYTSRDRLLVSFMRQQEAEVLAYRLIGSFSVSIACIGSALEIGREQKEDGRKRTQQQHQEGKPYIPQTPSFPRPEPEATNQTPKF